MHTGFDLIAHDRALQHHWLRRLLAFFFDVVLVFLPVWIFLVLMKSESPLTVGLLSGTALYLYCAFMEGAFRKTVGKSIMNLEVRSTEGFMTAGKALVRNIPKFFWYIFPLIDTVLGMATHGDPRQRFVDRVAKTTVIMRKVPGTAVSPRASVSSQTDIINPAEGEPQRCRVCGGNLLDLGGDIFQCSVCGQIQ